MPIPPTHQATRGFFLKKRISELLTFDFLRCLFAALAFCFVTLFFVNSIIVFGKEKSANCPFQIINMWFTLDKPMVCDW